jgi:dipeptidyl aminopeptidase/acylaminoacyl peptidase
MKYVAKLHSMNIRCELHVYPDGRHGLGVARDNPIVSRWTEDLKFWLHYMGYTE